MNKRPTVVIKKEKVVEVYADKYDVAPVTTMRIRHESHLDLIRYAAATLLTAGICMIAAMIDDKRRYKRKKK